MNRTIVVAVEDPALHPEVMHVAAASGSSIIDSVDPAVIARYLRSAHAILLDEATAQAIEGAPTRAAVYLLALDPGPIDWQLAIRCGAKDGFVIPAQSPELLRALGQPARHAETDAPITRNALGVLPVAGGAGASTLATALALKREQALLIDAVPNSGGLDLLLGAESELGARWGEISFGKGAISGADILGALPSIEGVSVLTSARSRSASFPMDAAEVVAAIDAAAEIDTIVDLPAWSEWTALITPACSALLLVVPAEVRAVSAAAEIVAQLRASQAATPVFGVLRHRSWSGLDRKDAERIANIEFVAELQHCAGVAKQIETHGLEKIPRGMRRTVESIFSDRRIWEC